VRDRVHPKLSQSDSVASIRNRVSLTLLCLILHLVETMADSSLPIPDRITCKTTKNPLIKLALLLETQRTLHSLRKVRHIVTPDNSSSDSIWNFENSNFTTDKSNFSKHQEAGSMENNDRTLKELATLDMVYQPWCIQCPPLKLAQSYELKSSLIHLLPKFHGLASEDPHKHLKELHMVYSTIRPQGILEDHIKMKVFPFSMDGVAKDWLYLQPVLFNTWGDMKRMFLEKLFLVSRTATIRKEICGISMVDAASGGVLMDKTPATTRHLISNMASNT
ncbi:hypothetical protein CR513_38956, partial [Mucuna pruriens]